MSGSDIYYERKQNFWLYLKGRRVRLPHDALPIKYNQKFCFLNNKYLNQTSRPVPIISLVCPELESIKIWVGTHLFLPLGQK